MRDRTTAKFADNLQDLIATSGKKVGELAKEINISSGSLSKYQNDEAEAGISALYKIANYFNVSIDWLLGRPGSVKALDPDLQDVAQYTGLSENVIRWLHSISTPTIPGNPELFFTDSMLDHPAFNEVLAGLNKLEEARYNSALDGILFNVEEDGIPDGGHIISETEYASLLEYRTIKAFTKVMRDITDDAYYNKEGQNAVDQKERK